MIFHITYSYLPERRNAAQQRFKETGAPSPAGITMIGRWHDSGGQRGFLIAETSEGEAIARWLQDWTDLLTFQVTPVLNDEQFTRVIS